MAVHVECTQSALWETGGAILVDGRSALLIDPGVDLEEVERIAERVAGLNAAVDAILITHAHSDHLCGIASFPDAQVCMGPASAAVVASGAGARGLASHAARHGYRYQGDPRCDRVLEPGHAALVGRFIVETLPVPGHTADGLAYRIRSGGVMAVGDYLSTYEFPFVYHLTAAYRATVEALRGVLEHDPPDLIVAGHGQWLDAGSALAIAEEDLAYLHALRTAVSVSLALSRDADEAVREGAAVEPPRATGENDARRIENARHQVAELQPSPLPRP